MLSNDGRTLWAVNTGYGLVAAIDVAAHRVREQFRFTPRPGAGAAGIAALSPDGKRLAMSDAQRVWFVELQQRRVSAPVTHIAIALGFAPDGKRVWVVGQRSRVSLLPVIAPVP